MYGWYSNAKILKILNEFEGKFSEIRAYNSTIPGL
jgi:hypothetical protein